MSATLDNSNRLFTESFAFENHQDTLNDVVGLKSIPDAPIFRDQVTVSASADMLYGKDCHIACIARE